MTDKYEYHKQNEYPGERVAEKKRVAERAEEADKKADARVAEKGRRNDRQMDSQRHRSESRARGINRATNTTYAVGVVIIVGLFILLLVMGTYSIITTRTHTNEINELNSRLDQMNYENAQLRAENNMVLGLTDTTTPTILYNDPITAVSPANNEINVDNDAIIKVTFSDDMNPATINTNTFIVKQRMTPVYGTYRSQTINGTVIYNENTRQATFTPNDGLYANQVYGDVFTATITTGIQDLNGNSLNNEYTWSFTTSRYSFNTGSTTTQTNQ